MCTPSPSAKTAAGRHHASAAPSEIRALRSGHGRAGAPGLPIVIRQHARPGQRRLHDVPAPRSIAEKEEVAAVHHDEPDVLIEHADRRHRPRQAGRDGSSRPTAATMAHGVRWDRRDWHVDELPRRCACRPPRQASAPRSRFDEVVTQRLPRPVLRHPDLPACRRRPGGSGDAGMPPRATQSPSRRSSTSRPRKRPYAAELASSPRSAFAVSRVNGVTSSTTVSLPSRRFQTPATSPSMTTAAGTLGAPGTTLTTCSSGSVTSRDL